MIHVHGYLGEISPATRSLAGRVALVVGGRRHLDALGVPDERRVVLGALSPAVERLKALPDGDDALVLASGDPGFHGIVRRLREEGLDLAVTPAVSSVAAAFAAVALPWDDALVVSAHGRPIDDAVAATRRHPKVAVLTGPGAGVRELAAALEGWSRRYVVAERLGEPDQRVRELSAEEAAVAEVAEPNVVLILDDSVPAERGADGPVVGQVTNSEAARRHADAIDAALGAATRRYDGPAAEGLVRAWRECDLIVSHLALGATARILAPLLADKKSDPGVVVVDEAGRFAVPLVGGHVGGANELARRIADATGGTPVLTTATDALNIPALDTLGWAYRGDVAGVTRAILDGRPVRVEKSQPWPLPPLPANVSADAEDPVATIVVTDSRAEVPHPLAEVPRSGLEAYESQPLRRTVVLHPRSLVVGMGCNRGTDVAHLRDLLERTLAEHGLALESVAAITTVDLKAGEIGLLQLVKQLGVKLIDYPADELAAQPVPTPSAMVEGHVGTPSVAEASVLAHGAELIVAKQRSTDATCAVGRIPARGRLSVVGLGPGVRDLLTPRAKQRLQQATFVVGYGPYVKQIRDLIRPGVRVMASKMGTEEARTAAAIEAARAGENVALVCGGDPAVYAMASPVLEQGTDGIDVDIVPGVTASLAVSAILGAPLGHDHATISLSDLHTPWPNIERRLQGAAVGDFVVALYNPRSRTRTAHLPRALEILGAHRSPETPVAVVQQACRPRQKVIMSTLAEFQPEWVDMNSLVVVGSSTTRFVTSGGGRRLIVTPRDYQWMPDTVEEVDA
ncbi:tetrapyrrole methylase [Tessaracoccus lapidicaptus]|uniref:Tetrapyrrole methylase n=1 Tax=Tessaracoccus lapidicaptus TaxID=1427523 RepID=A0A1C0AM33_9ACTN|nr:MULTISPECIES: precorrin-3B C(17)-methyltransferase [Tessaracoccus]AQX15483.1 tetrapyrrole methylase [Tessaracoccus sp. T2.5-30]OCL33851.1 tetrapyrrole methylase [Tessaracoccus lapidicaptus]VEP39803.1 putative cobalt-factor III C(17)-methyltransferase [Tessaracoccus lapidicaptus]